MHSTIKLSLLLGALPAALATVHDISVGLGGVLAYNPPYVNAVPGDIVNFVFHPKNHSVTQSSFDKPCVPLYGGFDSRFVSVPAEVVGLPNFPITVNDTNPIWVHCEQTVPRSHCGAGMVFAINPPPPPSPHSFEAFRALAIATNGPVDHKITVGAEGKLEYYPRNITAKPGDTVTFEFFAKNHTVTQSNFGKPCVPLNVSTGVQGFDSNFHPVGVNDTEHPTFQITINDTKPIWGHCEQTGHCVAGMVFSINADESPNSNTTFEDFLALAKGSA